MNPIQTPNRIALVLAIAMGAGLVACSKSDEQAAKSAAQDAKANASAALQDAKQATAEAGRDLKQSAQAAAADAKDAAASAGAEIKQGASDLKADAQSALAKAGDAASDAAITASVNAGLASDANLSVLKINVDTKDGVVTLNGQAPNAAAKDRASTIAKDVGGVKSVSNQLEIKG